MLRRASLWLIAIRDSFVTLLPITFFGVIAVLARDFPLAGYQAAMSESWPGWLRYLQVIIDATHGLFGMMLCVLIAVHLAHRLKHNETDEFPVIVTGISSLTNFMILAIAQGALDAASLGHDSILTAMGVGIFSAEALRWLATSRRLIPAGLPYETEASFFHAIRLTPPLVAIGAIVATAALLFRSLPPLAIDPWHTVVDMAHDQGAGSGWLTAIAVLISQVLTFIGGHGAHLLDAHASALFSPWGSPYDEQLGWRPMFNAFVLLGGSGATLGLLLAIGIAVREGPSRKVAKLSIVPGIFNINETIVYGLPVALNPGYLIPFIVVPLLLVPLTLAGIHLGFMEFQPVTVPWTTPPIISGWMLTGSWRGAAFQILELAVSTALYLPFVRKAEARRIRRQAQALAETSAAILEEGQQRIPVTSRHDQLGLIARGLLSDLRHDLAGNVLQLAYQPKHARDGQVIGVEALLRWPHARHGALSPALAVTLAEDSGDIDRLGYWVLEQACACKARWNKLGFGHIDMAVNVSPPQLSAPEFVPQLDRILDKYALRPDEIELEITESHHIPSTPAVDATLRQLSERGIRLAMDDFGMGYSSLLHLRRFHVHAIKIDGSLTRDVLSNATSADIIRSIATLGRAQKIQVIAEFVETLPQRERLAELGCDCFQGYLHSPALGEADCLAYFRRHEPA